MSSEEDESTVFPQGHHHHHQSRDDDDQRIIYNAMQPESRLEAQGMTPGARQQHQLHHSQQQQQHQQEQPQQQEQQQVPHAPFYYYPYQNVLPSGVNANNSNINNNTAFYPDQEAIFQSSYSQFMPMIPNVYSGTTPTLAPAPVVQPSGPQQQIQTSSSLLPSIRPKQSPGRRRNATSQAQKNFHKHKRQVENLSISSGLNTIHIKDEDVAEGAVPTTQQNSPSMIKQELESLIPTSKKIAERRDLNENELYIRGSAIQSLIEKVEIRDLARQLRVTRQDMDEFQSSRPNSQALQERERRKNIFAIRCFYECFSSSHENIVPFQSKVLIDCINSIDLSLVSPAAHASTRGVDRIIFATATPRSLTYSTYKMLCDICDVASIGQSGIGKLIRIAFPQLSTKRLGTRGNSKYHYVGMTPKPWIVELVDLYTNGHLRLPEPLEDLQPVPDSSTTGGSGLMDFDLSTRAGTILRNTSGDRPRNSMIKSSHVFPKDFDLGLDDNDPEYVYIAKLYSVLQAGDLNALKDFIEKLDHGLDLKELYYKELLFLSPLSYQLGDNQVLNNLNVISLNHQSFLASLQTSPENYNSTRFFLLNLGRLIKASRCSLSLSNMLYLYHLELASNLQSINVEGVIILEIDEQSERDLFLKFFQNLEDFFTNVSLIFDGDKQADEFDFISNVFRRENKLIMDSFVDFLIQELQKFENKSLRLMMLSFSKIITSITDEILRNDDLSMNFNNWWILSCWLNEWLSYSCELIAFKEEAA